jgi:hypothetical protein
MAEDVVETLEQKKEVIRDIHYKLEGQPHHLTRSDVKPLDTVSLAEDLNREKKIEELTLDGVEYFKRENVGGKTRWYQAVKPDSVTCAVRDIDPSAQKHYLQALLIQMDNKLHKEYSHHIQANPIYDNYHLFRSLLNVEPRVASG